MNNDSLPVEEVDAEIVPFTAIGNHGELIKDDNDELITKELDFILSDLSKDFKNKYEDRVVFIDEIPVEKQHEFVELFKTNDKDTINTTLEIIMNDYSKDKIEIINPPTTVIGDNNFDNDNAMELFNYTYHLRDTKYFDDMIKYGKNRHHTTKHQPNKKSKKSARRNNRRAKRNNR